MPGILLFVASFFWITITVPDNSPVIDPPIAEQFLRTGKIEDGCKALSEKLSTNTRDDEIRFGLGVLQITRAVEKLGQSLYRYGLQNTGNSTLFVRLPVPANPSPEAISIKKFRGILDQFQKDLLLAQETLSGITSETVKLRLRVTIVKMDFDNDGIPTDYLVDVIDKLMGGRPDFLKNNPEFRVHFDRGDVAWFRAYCHLLAAVVDLYQSLQTDADFYLLASSYFPKLEPTLTSQALIELRKSSTWNTGKFLIEDAKRLSSFRQHMLQVCQLNHETWKYILKETDNDYEWLPNPKQKSIFGIAVNADMITAWLNMMDELHAILEGKKLIPLDFLPNSDGLGFNFKTFLEEPPALVDFNQMVSQGVGKKYLNQGEKLDLAVFIRTLQVFDSPLRMGFFAWFN